MEDEAVHPSRTHCECRRGRGKTNEHGSKCTATVSSFDWRPIQIVLGHRGRVLEGDCAFVSFFPRPCPGSIGAWLPSLTLPSTQIVPHLGT